MSFCLFYCIRFSIFLQVFYIIFSVLHIDRIDVFSRIDSHFIFGYDFNSVEQYSDRVIFESVKSEYICQSESDVPFNNIFCGSKFSISVGEGILDFIYADFNTPYKEEQQFAYAMEFLWPKLSEELPDEYQEKLKESNQYADIKSEPVKVLSIEDEIYDDYIKFKVAMSQIGDIAYASLYSAICPPIFIMEYHKGYSTMRAYYLYLKNLQKEFLDLIEFCFDDEYYPEILGKMKPYERFYIYRSLNDIPRIFDRTETFKTTTFYTYNDNIPVWLTDKEYLKRNSRKIKTL